MHHHAAASVFALLLFLSGTGAEAVPVNPGDLLIADAGLPGVIRVDAGGNQTVIASGGNFSGNSNGPTAIAVGFAPPGTLFVVDPGCCVNLSTAQAGGVIFIDLTQPLSSNQTIFASGGNFVSPVNLAILTSGAVSGALLVVDSMCCGGGGVIQVEPTGPPAQQTVIAQGGNLFGPQGIAILEGGDVFSDLFIASPSCCSGVQGGVIRIDPSGNQTIVGEGGFFDGGPLGIALAPDGDLFVITGGNSGSPLVFRLDPTLPVASNQTLVAQGGFLTSPSGIALGLSPSSDLFVVDTACCDGHHGGVIRIDPTQPPDSNQSVFAEGGNFSFPVGITIVPSPDGGAAPVPGASSIALLTIAWLALASSRAATRCRSGARSFDVRKRGRVPIPEEER